MTDHSHQDSTSPREVIVYLIRHAQTEWHQTHRCAGQTDVGLSETGYRQATQVRDFFRERPIGTIVGSDLQRARLTAEPLLRERGLVYHEDADLREIHWGILEGTDSQGWAEEFPELMKRFPLPFDEGPTGGESRQTLTRRTSAALQRLVARHPGPIAVFSHAGAIKAILTHLILTHAGLPVDRTLNSFGVGNASVTTLRFAGGRWTVYRVNESSADSPVSEVVTS